MCGLYQDTEDKPCFYLGQCEAIHRKENIFLGRQEYQRSYISLYCVFSLKSPADWYDTMARNEVLTLWPERQLVITAKLRQLKSSSQRGM